MDSQAKSVGGCKNESAILDLDLDARQDRAGIFGSSGKGNPIDGLLQEFSAYVDLEAVFDGGGGGNSSGSVPAMLAWNRAQVTLRLLPPGAPTR